jgi:hypothetical protein
MRSDNRIVHGLWIGENLSNLELLTIKSFIANGHEFHLWLYEPLSGPLPAGTVVEDASLILGKDKIFRYKNYDQFNHGKSSLAGFSDIFRYKLLYEKGGWWCDMDVTCLRPLDFHEPYVFRDHGQLPAIGNVMKCPPRSSIMAEAYERARKEVDENNTDWFKPVRAWTDLIEPMGLSKYVKTGISNADSWCDIQPLLESRFKFPKSLYIRAWTNVIKPTGLSRIVTSPAWDVDSWRDPGHAWLTLPESLYFVHWCNEDWRHRGLDKNMCQFDSTYENLLVKYGVVVMASPDSE